MVLIFMELTLDFESLLRVFFLYGKNLGFSLLDSMVDVSISLDCELVILAFNDFCGFKIQHNETVSNTVRQGIK